MITKEIAISLRLGQTLHHVSRKNSDGTPMRVRVNGKCQTWKSRPNEFRLPVKHGLRDCGNITERNGAEWEVPGTEQATY